MTKAIVATDINDKCIAKCNICEGPLASGGKFYDARVRGYSSWAWMCETCFNRHGQGLDLGVGQEYDSRTFEKTRG